MPIFTKHEIKCFSCGATLGYSFWQPQVHIGILCNQCLSHAARQLASYDVLIPLWWEHENDREEGTETSEISSLEDSIFNTLENLMLDTSD